MNKQYTCDEMILWLMKYFEDQGYHVEDYWPELLPARVPLYCVRGQDNEKEEIIIEIIPDTSLSKDSLFPLLPIGKVLVPEASPARFYQYYFPYAKIFYAYPDYVRASKKFDGFKQICIKRGIGLLKTSEKNIEKIVDSHSLYDAMCNQLLIKKRKSHADIKSIIGNYLDSVQHYLVYYPEPIYTRRAIAGRKKGQISFVLIDKQSKLKRINYRKILKELSLNYRQKANDDYAIAAEYTGKLWKNYLGMEYPDIHRRIESILQRNEKYREHFVHQFQVFLIGTYIIDMLYDEVGAKFFKKYECKIEIAWLAAATFHDFNYGLQNFDEWLEVFFEDTLRIRDGQTKENLNILNLDAAMIREALYDKIVMIVDHLSDGSEKPSKSDLFKFFYEKMVRDRNHGVLSAVSLLKIYDENKGPNLKISEKGILEAVVAIGCHDEDIWESICGCQGYRRSSGNLPSSDDQCVKKCGRGGLLWPSKQSRIFKQRNASDFLCETWESKLMRKKTIEKIVFKDHPILFLLIFCDNIQDEGRIMLTYGQSNSNQSSLSDIVISKTAGKYNINAMVESDEADKKEIEIERVAWCLKDNRFSVYINNKLKKIDGNGGG